MRELRSSKRKDAHCARKKTNGSLAACLASRPWFSACHRGFDDVALWSPCSEFVCNTSKQENLHNWYMEIRTALIYRETGPLPFPLLFSAAFVIFLKYNLQYFPITKKKEQP